MTSKDGFSVVAPISVTVPSVDEEDGAAPGPAGLPGLRDDPAEVGNAGGHGADVDLLRSDRPAQEMGDRGLATARGSPEDQAGQAAGLGQLLQDPDDPLLADHVVERSRPEAGRQRLLELDLGAGLPEEVGLYIHSASLSARAAPPWNRPCQRNC